MHRFRFYAGVALMVAFVACMIETPAGVVGPFAATTQFGISVLATMLFVAWLAGGFVYGLTLVVYGDISHRRDSVALLAVMAAFVWVMLHLSVPTGIDATNSANPHANDLQVVFWLTAAIAVLDLVLPPWKAPLWSLG